MTHRQIENLVTSRKQDFCGDPSLSVYRVTHKPFIPNRFEALTPEREEVVNRDSSVRSSGTKSPISCDVGLHPPSLAPSQNENHGKNGTRDPDPRFTERVSAHRTIDTGGGGLPTLKTGCGYECFWLQEVARKKATLLFLTTPTLYGLSGEG